MCFLQDNILEVLTADYGQVQKLVEEAVRQLSQVIAAFVPMPISQCTTSGSTSLYTLGSALLMIYVAELSQNALPSSSSAILTLAIRPHHGTSGMVSMGGQSII